MKSSMSTWMRVGARLNHLELLEELTPQLSLTLRIPAAASPRLRSILLDAMSSAHLQLPAPPCLLTGAPQHPQGRRMELKTTLPMGLPLRTQARHCHWGTPPTFPFQALPPTAALSSNLFHFHPTQILSLCYTLVSPCVKGRGWTAIPKGLPRSNIPRFWILRFKESRLKGSRF